MITDAFNQAKQWPWAGHLFVYNWQDGTDPTTIDDNFGLVDSSGNAKPSPFLRHRRALLGTENGRAHSPIALGFAPH
ncbi:MAG: hypothetical protein ABSB99_11580 [Acidimicrobiales bacterium]|jgi:hypothetical protein